MDNRTFEIIERMIRYCDEITEARERFGDSFESLQADVHYRNSVSMSIMQIGELTTYFSDDFKSEYSEMPWKDIRGMRNIAAHHYGKFDVQKLWETISTDIPELKAYCNKIHQIYREENKHQDIE